MLGGGKMMYNKKVVNKGLSNAISVMFILIILISLAVPFFILLSNIQQANTEEKPVIQNYAYLRCLQVNQVKSGHPAFYYNGSYIYVEYSNGTFVPPSNVTIVDILYLGSNGIWYNITSLKYPIILSKDEAIQIPPCASGRPIIIITSIGNIFILKSGCIIGPYSSVSKKAGVEILTQIYESSGAISVSTNVTANIYGKCENFTTPAAFPNQTGTFEAKVPKYVYYQNCKGQIITGVFHNWIVLGKGNVNSTSTQGIEVTLVGCPLILIANYTAIVNKIHLKVIIGVSCPVCIGIDGQKYRITNNDVICIYAGYFNVTVITTRFTDTQDSSQGVRYHYCYNHITYNNNEYKQYSVILFAPPNCKCAIVYVCYYNNYNCYKIHLYKYNCYQNVYLILNGTTYCYGNCYWIKGGKYCMIPTGIFYGGCSTEAVKICIINSTGTHIYYYNHEPYIPEYIYICSPTTIKVYYGITEYWCHL
jgi:hypothetical protein